MTLGNYASVELHNKDQSVRPNHGRLFGSYIKRITPEAIKPGSMTFMTFYMSKTDVKAIDNQRKYFLFSVLANFILKNFFPDNRCNDTSDQVNVTGCLAEYIESAVGCRTQMQWTDPNLPLCNDTEIQKLLQTIKNVSRLNANEVNSAHLIMNFLVNFSFSVVPDDRVPLLLP